jgi:phosphatidylglycerophosphate synthase
VVLVIDPLAARVLPWLARHAFVTPNRLTLSGGVAGLASGCFFLAGMPIVGAILFELRFFLDCLDGKLARLTGTGSRFGGLLDDVIDVASVAWVYAAVGLWLGSRGAWPQDLALLPSVVVLLWFWAHHQLFATGRGRAPSPGDAARPDGSGVVAYLNKHRMTRLPGSVEATTVALFIAPLTGAAPIVAVALWVVVLGFYAPAAVHNLHVAAVALRDHDRTAKTGR